MQGLLEIYRTISQMCLLLAIASKQNQNCLDYSSFCTPKTEFHSSKCVYLSSMYTDIHTYCAKNTIEGGKINEKPTCRIAAFVVNLYSTYSWQVSKAWTAWVWTLFHLDIFLTMIRPMNHTNTAFPLLHFKRVKNLKYPFKWICVVSVKQPGIWYLHFIRYIFLRRKYSR